jgi:transcriptional regulator with XRE-family HTH domain
MRHQIRRVRREFTPEELAEWKRLVAEVDAEKDGIIADARRFLERRRRVLARLNQVLCLLRAERERQGLSLSDLQERTGIDRGALSKLENAKEPNPTISTLQRYAEALDKELVIQLMDREDANQPSSPPPSAAQSEAAGDASNQSARAGGRRARGFM